MITTVAKPEIQERIVMHNVSWSYYEQTLVEIGNQPIRVAYLDGMMELMSPLPEHEDAKEAIGQLIVQLTAERRIPRKSYGSSTFREEEKAAGSEPGGCFYFRDIDKVKAMKRFDPLIHRAPDLWIEVDLFSSSVARESICGRLGVPEIWRYGKNRIVVRLRGADGSYVDSPTSRVFPFLPMNGFCSFIPKMVGEDQTRVLLEFRDWVKTLST